jgi:hypothetical protein
MSKRIKTATQFILQPHRGIARREPSRRDSSASGYRRASRGSLARTKANRNDMPFPPGPRVGATECACWPTAAGLFDFVRLFAGGIGTSLIETGSNDRTILHQAQLPERTSADNRVHADAVSNIHAALGGSPETLNVQAVMLGGKNARH